MTHQDGIYFGMADDVYHTIPRLSGSGIKTMAVGTLDFWWSSWMNPDRPDEDDTKAKLLGKAYHKLILEGEEAFDAAYAVAPSKEDHPDALDGAEALRAKCEELGIKKSGRIADLCERIRDADPAVVLWPDIMAEFSTTSGGRIVLSKAQWQEIQRVRYVLRQMPGVRSAFAGGFPEVTILWTEAGVPMKARLDYLKHRKGVAAILDVKTFGNVMNKPIEEVPASEIARNRYFVQPVAYAAARRAARAMWSRQGRDVVHVLAGDGPTDDWLTAVLTPERQQFHFVFAQTGGVPNIIAREFAECTDHSGLSIQAHEYWRRGMGEYRYGVAMFRRCMELYGPDRPWVSDFGIRALRDDEFPIWSLQSNLPMIDDEAAE